MNLLNIIQEIEEIDPEFQEKINPRRAAIKNMTSFGSKVAMAAVPFGLGTMFKKAYGATPTEIVGILNFALTLEYLEYEFYNAALKTTGVIPAGAPLAALTKIREHEMAHVNFLKKTITDAGGVPVTPLVAADFDFTANGKFNDVFTNYSTLLAVAGTFEDTGVRAYKGQAPNLLGTGVVLTAALNIHSVEGRHASHIRQMRKNNGAPNIKPWITGSNDTGVAAVAASFAGEDNLIQAGVNITSLNSVNGKISINAATESFDEPLTKQAVLDIVKPFFKK